ncbi:MAG: T9SS type A sorting domain-containing protein [Bacteroidaceae bacterium]|nr:T9SS type A sorting domain-containing protein [Bacteroidaceae bacterium]MBQ3129392.1 T9SS type A sorting domain-containing protein [Bacteroidaceae bacterium]MEE0118420.1 T9SS type A sorting domain-containing protein [Bacteroidaceae bacterium]MEE1069277.1 T9SS type A sorting domain-containing protein [Paludibacteraceae bacterium]
MKRLWIIALSMLLLGVAPSIAHVQMDEPIEAEMETVTLTIQEGKAHITNAEGKTLEIYNLTGVRVARIRIDSNDKQITLNLTRGCYIMKVDKVVRKVTIL